MSSPIVLPARPENALPKARTSRLFGRIPLSIFVITAAAELGAFLSSNPLLTAVAITTLLVLALTLWIPNEPPILLFAATAQWLQVAAKVLYADYQNVRVEATSTSPQIVTAIWLGFVGLVVLAVGMRLGARRLRSASVVAEDALLHAIRIDRVFGLYLASAFFTYIATGLALAIPRAAQVILMAASTRWVFYYLLGYVTLWRREKTLYFVAATTIEFIGGIGYFSDFKTVFLVGLLVVTSLKYRHRIRTVLLSATVAAVLLGFTLAWMTIRDEYRMFLNQGTGQQVVLVSPVQEVTTFVTMVRDVNFSDLGEAAAALAERLAYVDYLAAVLDYVPTHRPFEDGAMLWRAIEHLLVPRVLYPEKAVLPSDSELTMSYTGLALASGDRGTSISMGYMAESYIDFGIYGMFVPVLLFGILWGEMYAYCVRHAALRGVGYAFGTALLMGAIQFEEATVKLLGGMVLRFLIFAVILRYAMPAIYDWLGIVRAWTRNRERA